MYRLFIPLVTATLFVIACNTSTPDEATNRKNGFTPVLKTKEDSLYHEVMQGHDAGMAKIGKLRKNIDETQRLLDSLNKLPSHKVNASYKQTLTDVHAALNNANNEMNKWMEEFKVDSASNNPDLRIQYLQHEKEKVTIVKQQIFTSLQAVDSLLSNK